MLYCYKEVCDEFQNRLVIRTGRPTNDLKTAKKQLARQEIGEIRDQFHRVLAVKIGPETKWVSDLLPQICKLDSAQYSTKPTS